MITPHVGQTIGGNVDIKVEDVTGDEIEIVAQKVVNSKLACSCLSVNLSIVVADLHVNS